MRILFLSGLYPPNAKGGGEISTHYIAQGLHELGHSVQVITSGEQRGERDADGISVLELPVSMTAKPLFERRHAKRIARAVRQELSHLGEFDIIHAHDFRTALALAELALPHSLATARDYAQICGTTNAILWDGSRCTCSWRDVVRTNRVVEAPLWRKPFRVWQYKFNINYRKRSFRSLPAQIFISHSEQEEIRRQQDISHQLTDIIYNPLAPDYLSARQAEPTAGSVLYVGTVETYKGVELLLDAWQAVAHAVPHAHLKIVGEGADRSRLERLVENRGLGYKVTFAGRVPYDRLRRLYDEASLVVAPHIWIEPFGRTVVEAMARNCLVVAADVGGPSEIIKDEETGLLFERGNAEALQRQLIHGLTMREGSRLQMLHAARSWVREHLQSSHIAKQHLQFYEKMLSAK